MGMACMNLVLSLLGYLALGNPLSLKDVSHTSAALPASGVC